MKPSHILVCARQDLRTGIGRMLQRARRKRVHRRLPSRVPIRKIKNMIIREGFAVADGAPSWFYTAYDRGDADPLTNYALRHIVEGRPREARILVTGCGTGITALYLADEGFEDVSGVDLLPECIAVAEKVKAMGGYENATFFVGDGLRPDLRGKYDVITALHWVFSAWMGNYGNTPVEAERAKKPELREELLSDLLSRYVPHLREGGELLIELTDAATDYRLPEDHHLGSGSASIYPVRHTPEQVSRVAGRHGLQVVDHKLCVSYGHHPRTLYILTNSPS